MLTATGLSLLYGLGFSLRKTRKSPPPESETSLKTKIEQLLTEARVIIPGGQALLGFQFVATLTKAFETLPQAIKWVHAAALAAVALSVLLLMTPAALHRLAFHGEDDPQFFEIGSRLVVAAALPLALGISADVAVVAYKITESGWAFFHLGRRRQPSSSWPSGTCTPASRTRQNARKRERSRPQHRDPLVKKCLLRTSETLLKPLRVLRCPSFSQPDFGSR